MPRKTLQQRRESLYNFMQSAAYRLSTHLEFDALMEHNDGVVILADDPSPFRVRCRYCPRLEWLTVDVGSSDPRPNLRKHFNGRRLPPDHPRLPSIAQQGRELIQREQRVQQRESDVENREMKLRRWADALQHWADTLQHGHAPTPHPHIPGQPRPQPGLAPSDGDQFDELSVSLSASTMSTSNPLSPSYQFTSPSRQHSSPSLQPSAPDSPYDDMVGFSFSGSLASLTTGNYLPNTPSHNECEADQFMNLENLESGRERLKKVDDCTIYYSSDEEEPDNKPDTTTTKEAVIKQETQQQAVESNETAVKLEQSTVTLAQDTSERPPQHTRTTSYDAAKTGSEPASKPDCTVAHTSTVDVASSNVPIALTKLDLHESNIARTAECYVVCAASNCVDAVDATKADDDIVSGLSNLYLNSTAEQ